MVPEAAMAKDTELLSTLSSRADPLLHLYEWESRCLTYGYFIDPSQHLDMDALRRYGLCAARRPTGGGIIFHLTDFAFSILIPASHPCFSLNTLDNYAYVNQLIGDAIKPLVKTDQVEFFQEGSEKRNPVSVGGLSSFCMAKPTKYDLICAGKKLGGAAQRRVKGGLLHQGSLSLVMPPMDILKDILKDNEVWRAIQQNTYPLFPKAGRGELNDLRQNIYFLLKAYFKTNF